MADRETLLADIRGIFENHSSRDLPLVEVIDRVLAEFNCVLGTIHELDRDSGMLKLLAHRGLPAVLLDKVSTIPVGKGMAGLAAERREPVQVCNLQQDNSGVAKPGAKLTGMEGSVSFPMIVGDETLAGTMGIAKPTIAEFSAEECSLLMEVGELVGRYLLDAR